MLSKLFVSNNKGLGFAKQRATAFTKTLSPKFIAPQKFNSVSKRHATTFYSQTLLENLDNEVAADPELSKAEVEEDGDEAGEFNMFFSCPFSNDGLEEIFEIQDEDFLLAGIIEMGQVQSLQTVMKYELPLVFDEMNKYQVNEEEIKQRAKEEARTKQRLIFDLHKKKRYTREQMVELVKSGQVQKLLEHLRKFEFRALDIISEDNEVNQRQLARVELFTLLTEYVRFLYVYGLWKDKLLPYASERLQQIINTFDTELPSLDKLNARAVLLQTAICTGKAPADAEEQILKLFAEADAIEALVKELWKANAQHYIPEQVKLDFLMMRYILPYHLFEQMIFKGKHVEAENMLDRVMAATPNQPSHLLFLNLKALSQSFTGRLKEATENLDKASKLADSYTEKYQSMIPDLFSLCNIVSTTAYMMCNNRSFVDVNLAATMAHQVVCWLDDEEFHDYLVEPMDRPLSVSMYPSLVSDCLKQYDAFESARWANLGLRVTQNYDMFGVELSHFVVLKAESIQQVPEAPRDLVEPLYIQARELAILTQGEKNINLVEINESYANFLEKLGGEQLEVEKLRQEAREIQEAHGYKYIKKHNLVTTLLHTVSRPRIDNEELKNYKRNHLSDEEEGVGAVAEEEGKQ